MSDESLDDVSMTPEIEPVVNKLIVNKKNITVVGSVEGIEEVHFDVKHLKVKKRRSKLHYVLPLTWSNEQWTASFSIDNYDVGQGVWDFYLHDSENRTDYRIKTLDEDEFDVTGEGFYNLSETSLRFSFYRTIKQSLSLNVQGASAPLEQVNVLQHNADKWNVGIEGLIHDSLIQTMLETDSASVVFTQRHAFKQIENPVRVNKKDEQYKINFNLNYKEMIDFGEVVKSQWDCYLRLSGDDGDYSLRIQIDNDNLDTDASFIERDSLTEFRDNHIFQIYFYETIKQNLSVKLHRVPIKQGIDTFTIESDNLHLQGYSYLDVHNFQLNDIVERSIIIRRRESNDEIIIDLASEEDDTLQRSHSFDIRIPIQKMIELEVIEKEVFDVSVQIQYQNAVYEKRLGFEQFTYIKDDVLGKVFLKNKNHYTRVYLTQTPSGNLKVETFYLTTSAYYYLKFGQAIDRKLNQSKEVWLIGERANTAQDTGYHFFKYCREHHPEINVFYVINSKSKDIKNIEPLGNVLYTGTLQHVRKASIATVFIGSHDLDNILPLKGLDLENYVKGKRVFLQHGVLGRKNVEYHKKYYRDPFHLFCVSSVPEKKLVEKKMGYRSSEVKVTGLSRFDKLLNVGQERQSILLMPTWREWLGRDDRFRESMYYERYKSLLLNETLVDLLEKYNLTLDFYPHYRMQPFIDEFKTLKSDRVNIIELGEKTVQQLLIENKLMITDYSSVSFDFNYMSKPIVFYHFDSRAFFKNGILRPKSETFLGDICKQEDEVIKSIKYYIENDFKEREEITKKKSQILSHIDTNNNQRIYNEIRKLQDRSD